MTTDLKQVGERIKGLRDALNLSPQEMATRLETTAEDIIEYEKGTKDISLSLLKRMEKEFGIDVAVLMFGSEPKMNSYFITRKDKGPVVERVSAYKYQSLTAGFTDNAAEVFIVTVAPKPEGANYFENIHPGQEFNFILEGSLSFYYNGKEMILNEGDCIYFNSSLPHGMKAMHGKPVKFLAAIINT
ncbi:MAG: XRE family transcriptional regulator [Dysgonamonadaceae bacterium]|jgi:transcriptional regulator with XRE-family HTH domain|nr:XRE family transcriptional regulator [Dysgonamonadaceae bacterium]